MHNYNGCFSKFVEYDKLVEAREKEQQLIKHTNKSNEEFSKLTK